MICRLKTDVTNGVIFDHSNRVKRAFCYLIFLTFVFIGFNQVHAGILFNADFETGNLSQWPSREMCCSHSGNAVSDVVRGGNYSMRIELRQSDRKVANGHRSEVHQGVHGAANYGIRMGNEYWYGYSTYIPANWDFSGSSGSFVVIAQWHSVPDFGAGDDWPGSPPLAVKMNNDSYRIVYRCDPNFVHTGGTPTAKFIQVNGQSTFRATGDAGKWTDWVWNIKWDYQNGFIKVWKDGVLLGEVNGCVTYNDAEAPYWKMGIYQSASQRFPRILYHDEFRIGDANSSYNEVAPNGSVGTFIQAPRNLTIVNERRIEFDD